MIEENFITLDVEELAPRTTEVLREEEEDDYETISICITILPEHKI